MSTMERRLQLLLDQQRYALVESEARASGRSVAAVIREAIDLRFDTSAERRARAASLLLGATEVVEGVEPDWVETKAAIEADLEVRG